MDGLRARALPPSETTSAKLRKLLENNPPQFSDTMRTLYISTLALAGTVSAWGAVILGSQAAAMPHRQAAAEKAVPLVAMAALSATMLATAAGAATDAAPYRD